MENGTRVIAIRDFDWVKKGDKGTVVGDPKSSMPAVDWDVKPENRGNEYWFTHSCYITEFVEDNFSFNYSIF